MPTFNTFDPTRFTEQRCIDLQAAVLKTSFTHFTYDDLPHLDAILDHCRRENEAGNPRAGQPATLDNLTKEDIETLYHFNQLRDEAAAAFIMLIWMARIGTVAKLN